ncbi:ATP-binding protein [Streptomyces telluris]|uniref:ATP-binding protein n=1 Tax=Streptomyces telluris TaxID=2720021 RepID=A0A9X2LQ65_9ACTN|nr:ATP-binding protein [Streptomyces telluris]MCQ8775134.1 ATP-binding protein [Streptomyces telluris]
MTWRRKRASPAAAYAGSSPVWRRILTIPLVPEAVRQARHDTTTALSEYGLRPDSAFAGAVLLVVSELVANAVRHAADQSPTADVTIAAGAGQLVIGVADQAPSLPVLSPAGMGDGLRTVTDLAAAYGGTLSVEPAAHGCGKVVLARFRVPDDLSSRRSGAGSRPL